MLLALHISAFIYTETSFKLFFVLIISVENVFFFCFSAVLLQINLQTR